MAMNGNGIRDTARVLKVNRNTVMNYFKKSNRVLFVNPAYVFMPYAIKYLKYIKCGHL